MKKIIDSGALRSDLLRDYLSASPKNLAILCDYASMEIYKGDATVNARKSLQILGEFPKQVVVLHPTAKISRLKPRASGIHSRFKDEQQTEGFAGYCAAILGGKSPEEIDRQLSLKGEKSRLQMEIFLKDTETARTGILELAKSIKPDDLRRLRKRETPRPEFVRWMGEGIMHMTMHFLVIAGFSRIPPLHEAKHSFPFRLAACTFGRAIEWIAEGGLENHPKEKLNNDFVDMAYAAYATFYDGIITRDQRLSRGFRLGRSLLEMFDR